MFKPSQGETRPVHCLAVTTRLIPYCRTAGVYLGQGWPWFLIEIFRAPRIEFSACHLSWVFLCCKGLYCLNDLLGSSNDTFAESFVSI